MRRSYPVARSLDLNEGELRACVVGSQSILLARVGAVYAIVNSCPHAGSRLETGTLTSRILRCPAHGFRFDITTGKHTGPIACPALATFEVTEENGEIAVILED